MPRGKPKDGSKNPGGRPRKNWHNASPEVIAQKVFELASHGWRPTQIASFLQVSKSSLHQRYNQELEKGLNVCGGNLFQKQFEVAMSGNPTMLIWLGKQFGQADKSEISGPDGKPIALTVDQAKQSLADFIASLGKTEDRVEERVN